MIVFLIKRLANAAFVMLVVALMAFMIFRFVGDPVQLMVNEQTTQAERDELRERLGLNQPMPLQYLHFVTNAVQGDFGISYRNQQEVMSLIAERFPATIELVLMATIISLVVGVPLGVITAIHRGKWYSEGLQFLSIIGVSLPSFVIGIMLILVFSVMFNILSPGAADMWKAIMPQVIHVHGKFYDFDEAGNETSIAYDKILPVFHDGGYTGFMSSEWEGHLYMRGADAFEMVAKHHALARRILGRHTGVAA